MPKIEIYTQVFCPYCARALSLLRKKGVAFQEIDAPGGSAARAEAHRAFRRQDHRAADFHRWRIDRRLRRSDGAGARRQIGCIADDMIHYQLRCDAAHEFDGWFKDSAGFERQAEKG